MKTYIVYVSLFALVGLSAQTAWSAPQGSPVNPDCLYRITVTNLTEAQAWGKPIMVSHDSHLALFTAGAAASAELQALAEEGDNQPLAAQLRASPHVRDVLPSDLVLAPGESRQYDLTVNEAFPLISVAGMMGTTNDTFAALDSIMAPEGNAAVTYYPGFWDAGTERNSELCEFIPGAPCNSVGMRDADGAEGFVALSRGLQGVGDLNRATAGWTAEAIKIEVQFVK